jgi:hypothetical protein
MVRPNISANIRRSIRIVLILFSAIALAGCNLPQTTSIPASPTPMVTYTATPAVTLTATISSTPEPTATLPVPPSDIAFAPGTTAAVVQGSIQPGQSLPFSINAGADQAMILILDSQYNDASLAVYEADGSVLLDPAQKWNRWQWLLPKTQQYTIEVIGGANAQSFVLTVKVAAHITMVAGTTSTVVSGTTQNGYVFSYSVKGAVNQTMSVTLTAPPNTASLDIFGLAFGEVLLSPSDVAVTWTGKLPSTEDYVIEVIPNGGQVIDFSLTISFQ